MGAFIVVICTAFFTVEYLLSVVDKDIICAAVLRDQGQHGQCLFFQLTNIIILTLLPAMVVSLLDQPHFFVTAREYVLLRICHVMWNGSDHWKSIAFTV